MESMRSLIKEILDDHPMNECADEGTNCVFCGAPWSNSFTGNHISHALDCWINRATKVLEETGV